jgi:nucleoside 2-deoxyribosyltransferase
MKVLICGTRKKGYEKIVRNILGPLISPTLEIVEGCCPDSADEYAEKYAKEFGIKVHHFPSTSGNYLKRNIEMVKLADEVIAFWDNFSYGTCHTIATAIRLNKPVRIITI